MFHRCSGIHTVTYCTEKLSIPLMSRNPIHRFRILVEPCGLYQLPRTYHQPPNWKRKEKKKKGVSPSSNICLSYSHLPPGMGKEGWKKKNTTMSLTSTRHGTPFSFAPFNKHSSEPYRRLCKKEVMWIYLKPPPLTFIITLRPDKCHGVRQGSLPILAPGKSDLWVKTSCSRLISDCPDIGSLNVPP